jgi:hypothetical protein
VPQEVLVDNARALVSQDDLERQILVFAQRLEKITRYWGSTWVPAARTGPGRKARSKGSIIG